MCVVPVRVKHNSSDKEVKTFALLDTCSQGTFLTEDFVSKFVVSGVKTSIKIKTLNGNQKQSLSLVQGLTKHLATDDEVSVDVLIGANRVQALESLDVIPSQCDGPYVFRITLG